MSRPGYDAWRSHDEAAEARETEMCPHCRTQMDLMPDGNQACTTCEEAGNEA